MYRFFFVAPAGFVGLESVHVNAVAFDALNALLKVSRTLGYNGVVE